MTPTKHYAVAILLTVVLAIAACTSDTTENTAEMQRYTMQYGGLQREYFVFLPSSYDKADASPVAIFMHGYGGTATGTEAEVTQGLNRYAEEFGYVMIYPQGTWFMADAGMATQWEVSSWNHISDGFDVGPSGPICAADSKSFPCPPECGTCGRCGWTSCHDDVGFLKQLVATTTVEFHVDSERFYVAGFSNGAMMTHRMACEASDLFAAAALVGGRLELGFECTPTERLPILQMNGGEDKVVPLDASRSSDGFFYSSTAAVTERWNDGAACASESREWTTPSLQGESATCNISCPGTAGEVVDCIFPEGDHRWPGTPGTRGSNGACVTELQSDSMPEQPICIAADPDAKFWGSQLMFEFFDAHPGQ